ncbi:MAG: VCBS repeat-containing protein [Planctomycetota bacterium]|nr:VCBS repeat-containing protein [Planctomycetota bacterium]
MRCRIATLAIVLVCAIPRIVPPNACAAEKPWPRHTIDDSSHGADGVRLADVNSDGRVDIVTGWEEGGVTRVYLNPGPAKAKTTWPAVTVGKTPNVEDAVFCDLDHDGATDVVTCCEGRTRTMFVHWAPKEPGRYLDPKAWTTEPLPTSAGRMMWMFCVPAQVDGQHGDDLIAAGKGAGAAVGWFESPANPRDLAAWTWHPLPKVGWIMSLRTADVNQDGAADILASDRKGPTRGVFWLEHPGPDADLTRPEAWKRHDVGGGGREVMFLDVADLDGDGLRDVVVATKPQDILFFRCLSRDALKWESHTIRMPDTAGTAKAVAVGDIDADGKMDLVFSCEGAGPPRAGVMWLSRRNAPTVGRWQAHDISGPEGVKFDRIELLDLDGDGDRDVLTCEERAGLGVIWYENPAR